MKWNSFCVASVLALKIGTAAAQGQYTKLQQLIDQADYKKAYQLAESYVVQSEGDPAFDYLYGIAALKTQHSGSALFAFERVLQAEPDNYQAHYYYAYAYYQSKVYARAYIEARKLKAKPIPPDLKEKINVLILKITREEKADPQKWVFVSLTGGHDSNVNGGVNQSNVQLVGLGFVPLDVDAKQFSSNYAEGKIGAGAVWPLHGKLTTQVMANWRRNESAHLFDTDEYALFLRYELPFSVYRLAFPLMIDYERLNHREYRSSGSAGIELSYAVSESFLMRPFFNLIAYDYPRDATQTSKIYWGGIGFENLFPNRVYLALKPYWGSQVINNGRYHYNNRSFTGIDFMMRHNHWRRLKPFIRMGYQYSTYHYPHPLLETGSKRREDGFYHAELGFDWRLVSHIYLTVAGIREINNSNFDVFEYRRNIIKTSLTYSSL